MTGLQRKTPLKARTGLKTKAPMKRSPMKGGSKPKMTAIRKSARGQPCQVRSCVCNGNPETVVLAHRNGAGMACKADDRDAAYACSDCHSILDGGYVQLGMTRSERDALHDEAIARTQRILTKQGLMEVAA